MRALAIAALLAGPAAADDTAKAVEVDPELVKKPLTDPNGFTGDVIVPPKDFADAQPWPRGMVITPPDTHDPMPNLVLRPWRWGNHTLWERFEDAVGGVLGALGSPRC